VCKKRKNTTTEIEGEIKENEEEIPAIHVIHGTSKETVSRVGRFGRPTSLTVSEFNCPSCVRFFTTHAAMYGHKRYCKSFKDDGARDNPAVKTVIRAERKKVVKVVKEVDAARLPTRATAPLSSSETVSVIAEPALISFLYGVDPMEEEPTTEENMPTERRITIWNESERNAVPSNVKSRIFHLES